jgi:hypothetical protein
VGRREEEMVQGAAAAAAAKRKSSGNSRHIMPTPETDARRQIPNGMRYICSI